MKARGAAIAAVAVLTGFAGAPVDASPRRGVAAPANGRIVFEGWGRCGPPQCVVEPTNPYYDIWSVEPDGSGLVNLTKALGVDTQPAWSPDGSEIVFASNRAGDYDLYSMDADGESLQQITAGPGDDNSPTWSPNGKRIAFVNTSARTEDIVVMRRDGTRRRVIASFKQPSLGGLEWSPAGGWITLTKGPHGPDETYNVFVIRTDGTGLRRIDRRTSLNDTESATWSPDGKWLALAGDGCLGPTACPYDIYVIRRDGTGLRRIAGAPDAWEDTPRWSPDGSLIVYTSEEGDLGSGGDLWVVKPDGSDARQVLTKPDTYDYGAAWQPLP